MQKFKYKKWFCNYIIVLELSLKFKRHFLFSRYSLPKLIFWLSLGIFDFFILHTPRRFSWTAALKFFGFQTSTPGDALNLTCLDPFNIWLAVNKWSFILMGLFYHAVTLTNVQFHRLNFWYGWNKLTSDKGNFDEEHFLKRYFMRTESGHQIYALEERTEWKRFDLFH